MKYKLKEHVTDEMLIGCGFEYIDMAIIRAKRNNITIFLGLSKFLSETSKKNSYYDEKQTIFYAYSHYENMPKKHMIEKNIIYDEYSQKELDNIYPIQDLIELDYVEIITHD